VGEEADLHDRQRRGSLRPERTFVGSCQASRIDLNSTAGGEGPLPA